MFDNCKKYASAALLLASLTALLTIAGCATEDVGDCPTNAEAQEGRGSLVLTNKCVTCHSSKLSGAERGGAPVEYNYDDPAQVEDYAEMMYYQAVEGLMPPSGKLSTAEIEDMRVYLACLGK
jgi:cytochrome c5